MATAPTAPRAPDAGTYGPQGRSAWMDIDWREHQRWLTVHGRRVNLIELGQGPPVVFVHGLAGSWQNWLEQLPAFAEHHRVIAMDLPGFGHSEMPAEKISISGYARTLDALCDQLDVDAAAFVGNSMGGFTGAELAISFPERVERLVLVAAAGLTIEHQRSERGLALLRRAENVLAFYTGWVASRSENVARRPRLRRATLALVARHPERLPGPLAAEQIRGSGTPGFIDALDALTDYPIRARLGEIACPTLIVWGTHDRLVPVRDASEFERLIPNARKVVFDDTGHVPMLERPAAFNRALQDFLDE
ncbi:MAG TPA: alpha/beta fold hydrolase [Solirubrobacteraceae bacterium]|nr:alpha/beta fold hydrolase [Solirubrobacteraceae bacterium]